MLSFLPKLLVILTFFPQEQLDLKAFQHPFMKALEAFQPKALELIKEFPVQFPMVFLQVFPPA